MPYFKDDSNRLWWLDEDQSIDLIPESCVQIENSEAELIIEQAKEDLKKQEAAQQPTISDLQAQLAALTSQLAALAGSQ